jgi:signal transduction histidine kinase
MLLISVVFTIVFLLVFIAGGLALFLSVKEQIDDELAIDKIRMAELFENEFLGLLTATGEERKTLREQLYEELDEIYRLKNQFCIYSLEQNNSRHVLAGGVFNIQLLLPKGFLDQPAGYYNQRLDDINYRVLISKHRWGTLVIGIENQTLGEVADEFKDFLLIIIPVALALIFLGGRFLSRKVMQPVVKVTHAAKEISIAQLHSRLPAYSAKDEFGILVETLNDMMDRIEEGTHQIRQFTQDAAHELRTPLTLLRGELELFYQQDDLSDEMHESLQKMLDRAIWLTKIIDDLLLLAQSDVGKYEIIRQPVPLDRLVSDIVEDAKALAGGKDVDFRFERGEVVLASGDEQLLRRLLLNLAGNAVKYTDHGAITFSIIQAEKIIVSIADTGIGIPQDHLQHVFDRFHRVDPTRGRNAGSSGLGLAICKWIAHAHGGDIHISSVVGQGTTVTVSLPTSI